MESYENEVKDLIEVTFPEKDDFLKIRGHGSLYRKYVKLSLDSNNTVGLPKTEKS